jgi:hypothetical protein
MTADDQRYPDHLKGIWELGRYLESLRGIYSAEPAAVIKGALSLSGVLGPACLEPGGREEEAVRRLHEIMKNNGDG